MEFSLAPAYRLLEVVLYTTFSLPHNTRPITPKFKTWVVLSKSSCDSKINLLFS